MQGFKKFNNIKIRKENKSLRYFCSSTVSLSSLAAFLRASYVTRIIKRSIARNPEIPASQTYEWVAEGRIHGVQEIFPDDINEILLSDEYDEEDVNGENCGGDEEKF